MRLLKFQAAVLMFAAPALSFSPACISSSRARPYSFVLLHAAADSTETKSGLLSLKLEKPLGMLLEEIEEGAAKGVKVQELLETGSAYASSYRDALVGLQVARVMGQDVLNVSFEQVMDTIMEAPSPVEIEFVYDAPTEASSDDTSDEQEPEFEVGTKVVINVIQEGNPDRAIEAEVGQNLRKVLLDNNVEVYRGMKKKLGNCGGAGQCTFCAVDFVESQGWAERSEYEEGKIGKYPRARLACMNNIQGPATIRVQ